MNDSATKLFDEFRVRFSKAKYVAGLLLAFTDLVEQAGARGRWSDAGAFLAARRVKRTHQLVVLSDSGEQVRLRALYEEWERVLRYEMGRGDYPSTAPHAVGRWESYWEWLDALLKLSAEDSALLRAQVVDHVLTELPEAPPSQKHGIPIPSVDAVHLATTVASTRPRTRESELRLEIERTYPRFRPEEHGAPSLQALFRDKATGLAALDVVAGEVMWSTAVDDDEPGMHFEEGPPSQLRRVEFKNYRSLVDTAITLGSFTILVGTNGSGKTNLLDGLFRLARMTRFPPATLFRGRHAPARVRTYGRTEPFSLHVVQAAAEWSWVEGQDVTIQKQPPAGPVAWLRLDPRRIAAVSRSDRTRPRVGRDGGGVSTVLADLASTDPSQLKSVLDGVRGVLPFVEDLRIPRAPIDGELGHQLQAKVRDQWIPADQLSDGTLLTIALHTALVSEGARLLLLDDLDHGLHPSAQRVLLRQLLALAESGQVQIVATTHSHSVLDVVPPDEVRTVRVESGNTVVRELTSHPEWQNWNMMTAGEFWSYIGEDWLVTT